jgi:hypothetical protein
MLDLNEKYIVDKKQKAIAVQLDIKTFKRLEEVLEDYALAQYMKNARKEARLDLGQAKTYYRRLIKK